MNITVRNNERGFSFSVVEEKGDIDEMGYNSERDSFLLDGTRQYYPTFTHAHCAALKIAERHPEVVRAKKIAFSATVEDGNKNEFDEFKKAYVEMKRITRTASSNVVEDSRKGRILDCLRFFAEASAVALNPVNKSIHIKLAEFIPESESYNVVLADNDGDVCCVKFDNRMLLSDVSPCGKTIKETPYHSREFFEKYFEPIYNSIGHISLSDGTIGVVNHYSTRRRKLAAFSQEDGKQKTIVVSLPSSGLVQWRFSEGKTDSDVPLKKNYEVKCIRSDLPTYYGRTGEVVEEIDRGTYKEIVVDFRRGLGLVVMTEDDVQPLNF